MKIDIKIPDFDKSMSKIHRIRDWWIWIVSVIFVLAGAALIITFSILLSNSYKNGTTNVAAYAGAIGAGLAAMIAAVTQIVVFVHKIYDEQQKRLEKAEHDYTNFFIKNFEYNELVLINLEFVINQLGISYKVNNKSSIIEFNFPSAYKNISFLRQQFVAHLIKKIESDSELGDMLIDKYNLPARTSATFYSKFFSCIDTEIKKTLNSFEKLLLNLHNDKYDEDYYFDKIKNSVRRFLDAIFPYIVLVIINNINQSDVENYPYIIYAICKEG